MNDYTTASTISMTLSKSDFIELRPLYCYEVGNFQMSKSFMLSHIDLIEKFISIHSDYFLVYQPMIEYDGEDWFLTNFTE